MMTLLGRAGRATAAVAMATLIAGCGSGGQSEFAGDGWFQGNVLACKAPGHCEQLRFPQGHREVVFVDLRLASTGKLYGGSEVATNGTFGWFGAPGKYVATLRPVRVNGLRAETRNITLTANGRIAFDLAYGRRHLP